MSDATQKISDRISVLENELMELRIAHRVIQKFASDTDISTIAPAVEKVPREKLDNDGAVTVLDLRGKTVIDAMKVVLSESAKPIHFRTIYERATLRGYQGRKPGKDNSPTFWAALNKNKEIFRSDGDGFYSLIGGVTDK